MSKIAKFLASALNNSSANEAAQALKMAAAAMQSEGVNPRTLLQAAGTASAGSSTVIEALRREVATLKQSVSNERDDYNRLVKKHNDLVAAYRHRGVKNEAYLADIAELEKKLADLQAQYDIALDECAHNAVKDVVAPNYSSPYGSIIKDVEAEEAARAVNSRQFHKLCEVFSNLKGIEGRINGNLKLMEPDSAHSNGVIYIFLNNHASGSTSYAITISDSGEYSVTVYHTGKRGGSKGTDYLSFANDAEMMRALFKHSNFLVK